MKNSTLLTGGFFGGAVIGGRQNAAIVPRFHSGVSGAASVIPSVTLFPSMKPQFAIYLAAGLTLGFAAISAGLGIMSKVSHPTATNPAITHGCLADGKLRQE